MWLIVLAASMASSFELAAFGISVEKGRRHDSFGRCKELLKEAAIELFAENAQVGEGFFWMGQDTRVDGSLEAVDRARFEARRDFLS
jgi:hypothetical protein